MISVVQRCSQANVNVGGNTIGEIGIGFVVLLGIQKNDSVSDADYIVKNNGKIDSCLKKILSLIKHF